MTNAGDVQMPFGFGKSKVPEEPAKFEIIYVGSASYLAVGYETEKAASKAEALVREGFKNATFVGRSFTR
jgi:hypothetical protein